MLMPSDWHVYIVRCSDHSLYTGIATDVEARLRRLHDPREHV